jgi:arylsulfatase
VPSAGCSRRDPTLDLAALVPAAGFEAPFELALFGSVAAEAVQGAGFLWTDGHAWVATGADVVLRWPTPAPRVLVLDAEPYPGLVPQSVELALNDAVVGRVALAAGRRRHVVDLPVPEQRAGRNVLRLSFAKGAPRQRPHRLSLAAALHTLAVVPADDGRLAPLREDGAAAPLEVVKDDDGRPAAIAQVGPSTLAFAFEARRATRLRFAPRPGRTGTGPARVPMRVTLEPEEGGERELWSRVVEGDGGEVVLRLGEELVPEGSDDATRLTRLRLHVGEAAGTRGVWGAPRLEAVAHLDPLADAPAPVSPAVQAEAERLRRALPGTSVLLVLLDAAGARHLGCYGYDRPTTPEIDRLAREGVLFERAKSPAGFTLLAMSTLWTGQQPDQHHNGIPYNAKLPAGAVTLAELLRAHGVLTAGFVHNAFAGTAWGLDQGFVRFDELYRRAPRAGAEVFPPAIEAFLAERGAERFFAYLHLREPHFPYHPQPPFNTLFGPDAPLPRAAKTELDWLTDVNWRRTAASPEEIAHLVRLYDGNLRYADEQVGRIRRALEAAGLLEKTVLIVTADHGEALHEHGFIGHLHQVYEEVTHVPLIVRFPAAAGLAGRRLPGLVDLADVAPTVAELLGVPLDGEPKPAFRGRSLLPVALGAPGKPAVVSRTAEEQPKYALQTEAWSLVYHTARGQSELFDLAADPLQRRDLAAERPVLAAFYRQALHRWLLEQRRGPRAAAEEVRLGEEEREALKALGYVQ